MFYSLAAFFRKIMFLPLENKIHIFAPPCNVLYTICIHEVDNNNNNKDILTGGTRDPPESSGCKLTQAQCLTHYGIVPIETRRAKKVGYP